ncbi:apoptosis-inducing factor 2 [Dichotomopilus funicola]|uniref:Apoptosis-inducing factor 2 n=1 Tax=Dichotomopilus funicola TaxID=1934379 RepID=A0AAN6ZHR4_9PEZI|nr:apoptosis-inducing factor 2 [Dichotomopilus funicola]
MAPKCVQKAILLAKLVAYGFRVLFSGANRALWAKSFALTAPATIQPIDASEVKNVVVVGAAFAGYFAARSLAATLPRDGRYRLIIIEPNSHFNFTWVLPRFCVVEGHEHKAFIPYTPDFFAQAPPGMVQWVRDRVVSVGKHSVVLRDGDEIAYEYLLIATGSTVANGLPSRVGSESRENGIAILQATQARIKAASRVVIAGGGAAGVELATDAKERYPEKSITLVHSRQSVMHRFGPELQKGAMDALRQLGVDLILGEKVDPESADGKFITLASGRQVECDCFFNCTGQKPASGLMADIAPGAIAPSGHIRVKPTLQIDDDSLPNVFVCGDVADVQAVNPNSRIAGRQAEIAADNIVLAARGKPFAYTYKPEWGDEVIKLTVGLNRSITDIWDGQAELMFTHQEADPALMCGRAWQSLGAKPFEDTGDYPR